MTERKHTALLIVEESCFPVCYGMRFIYRCLYSKRESLQCFERVNKIVSKAMTGCILCDLEDSFASAPDVCDRYSPGRRARRVTGDFTVIPNGCKKHVLSLRVKLAHDR